MLSERQLDEEIRDLSAALGLRAGDADFVFHVHAEQGRYYISALDAGPRLVWRCTGSTPNMPNHLALIYGAHCALAAISASMESERLCQRHGFSTRRAARQSLRKLKVSIFVTDRDLAELAQSFPDAEDPNVLLAFMPADDRDRYKLIVNQIKRFATTWRYVPADSGRVSEVIKWATPILNRVAHDGEVRSPKWNLLDFPAPTNSPIDNTD